MDRKALWKQLCFPPLWLLALLTVFSGAGLVFVFANDLSQTPMAYGLYGISFYTVCVLTAFCGTVLPAKWRALRGRIHAHPLGHRYMTDAAFKTHVSLYASLAVNLLYAGVNVLSWCLYRSMWFVVLAVYYGILAVMRFLLVRYTSTHRMGQHRMGELQRARLCASILLLVNFALTGAVMMILYQDKGVQYHGVLIYVMAAYTFYITILAICNVIRYRKYHSPVMTIAKIVSLSAALVSMLSLETAMLSRFGGEMTAESRWLMIALTGAGVSLAVIGLSSYMIVRTTKEIEEIKIHGE